MSTWLPKIKKIVNKWTQSRATKVKRSTGKSKKITTHHQSIRSPKNMLNSWFCMETKQTCKSYSTANTWKFELVSQLSNLESLSSTSYGTISKNKIALPIWISKLRMLFCMSWTERASSGSSNIPTEFQIW